MKHVSWFSKIHFENVFWVIFAPLFGFIAATSTPLLPKTALLAVAHYFATGLGITAGYHRLWAHRSYTASVPLKLILAAFGAGAMEHSIINWSRDHRAHHRYTDTNKDPYSAHKGLFHAHIGWLFYVRDIKGMGDADISDLMNETIVVWQHKLIPVIALCMAFVLPAYIGSFWGDAWGAFIYAGVLRAFVVQQSTFCVNSVAHWLGEHTFDDRRSPRDHALTALITLGEGYHNFHHEFPSDYRNAIAWYQYDPTKWLIWLCGRMGLAQNLKMFRSNEIEKGRLQQQQKALDLTVAQLQTSELQRLPIMTWDEYQDGISRGQSWLTIAGVIYDVEDFVDQHPGGRAMIQSGIGKDATAMFNGGIYNHSNHAHRLLTTMNIAIMNGGGEVEILKQQGEPAAVEGH